MKRTFFSSLLYTIFCLSIINSAFARDRIRIVGSTSVYIFSTAVAERFGKTTGFKTPLIEANGTGNGIKLFCSGIGPHFPDIVNASRPMSRGERQLCQQHGIQDPIEIQIGYDGIVIGTHSQTEPFNLSCSDIYQALAEKLPKKQGGWQPNPHQFWQDVNPLLPRKKIIVLAPPSTSGIREVFSELVIRKGCQKVLQDPQECSLNLREDGAFREMSEQENIILQKLDINPEAIGIFSFGFLEQNRHKTQALPIEGVIPSFETISNGRYPLSRPLYFYIKKEHISLVPGLREYAQDFLTPQASGPYGYLSMKGLIPLSEERKKIQYNKLN